MTDQSDQKIDEEEEFFVIPESQLHYLPEQWQSEIREMAANGRAVLSSVDDELTRLSKLTFSLTTLATLNEVSRLLQEYQFEAGMQSIFYLEILTTSFVVTYSRLFEGGSGSGFSRKSLPQALRNSHDQIIDLRNKRFAHQAEHHTVETMMEVQVGPDGFQVFPHFSIGIIVGGANEWHQLVNHLNEYYYSQIDARMARLSEKTGHQWKLADGPKPEAEEGS